MLEFHPTEWETPCKRFSITKCRRDFDLMHRKPDGGYEPHLDLPTFEAAVELANSLDRAWTPAATIESK